MGGRQIWLSLALLAACGLSPADELPSPAPLSNPAQGYRNSSSRFILVGGLGRSLTILGSEELRRGYTLGLQYELPNTRARLFGHNADLVLEGYYGNNRRGVLDLEPPSTLISAGVLVFFRFKKHLHGDTAYLVDLGWGLTYGSDRTRDLDSRLNSSPALSFWISHGPRHREFMYGLRYLHLSNAGFVGNNQGQNQIFLTFGIRL
ncbi:MAG: acyloxyacyl hydrolase [Fimbriimonadaceae bacterium]|nr:acyloxyacyl hydrolase [Fimbriimonadaceae bacterium]